MTELVTPDPEQLGIRVTGFTPLAKIVGRLKRLYPDMAYVDLRTMADRMRRAKPVETVELPEPVEPPVAKPKRRRLKTEADDSMVPVEGGEPIPAEPPTRW